MSFVVRFLFPKIRGESMRSLQTELIDKGFVKSMKERKQVSKKKKEIGRAHV